MSGSELVAQVPRGPEWLAKEQAALRRVATLVASGTPHDAVLRATVDEVREILSVDLSSIARYELPDRVVVLHRSGEGISDEPFDMPLGGENVATLVAETEQAARMDDYSGATGPLAGWARREGVSSIVGAPVIVAGQLWGVMSVATRGWEPLPAGTEGWLASFTDLLALAIANVQSQEQTARLLEEQAALRRVATLVAQDTAPADLFVAVSAEVDLAFGLDPATFDVAVVGRFDPGPELVVVGISKSVDAVPLGSRWPPEELFAPTHVLRTGCSFRISAEDVASAHGGVAEFLRQHSYLSQVASPIVVNGRLWGAMSVNGKTDFPTDTEERLERFTELVATSIANAESRETLARLADEQAALRRVATLVAAGATREEILAVTADQVRQVMQVDVAAIARYLSANRIVTLQWSGDAGFESREGEVLSLGGTNVATQVAETMQPARIDRYADASGSVGDRMKGSGFASAVGVPVIVNARLWGLVVVATSSIDRLPGDTEQRLMAFTELLATAIANVESLGQLRRLLDEQSALRRLATLIVTGTVGYELLAATADEVRQVIDSDFAAIARYLPDDRIMTVHWSGEIEFPSRDGEIHPLGGSNVATEVGRTGKTCRMDSYAGATGAVGASVRASAIGSTVGVPVVVDGELWGLIIAGMTAEKPPLTSDAEARLERFTELLAAGVANAESRAELTTSRARVVAASDETRRRIERDLHDGVQQRILSLVLEVQQTQAQLETLPLGHVVDGLNEIQDQLREITSGLHPAMLAEGGITSALGTLARRAPLPVYLDISLGTEPSEPVEVAVYFIVSELITNAAKHAQASRVLVALEASDGVLRLAVEDDGVGGADPSRGSGLLGLSDRVAAMSGVIELNSPHGGGTAIRVELPLDWVPAAPATFEDGGQPVV